MSISKKDAKKIITLAKEGKKITAIAEEDFPQYDYWDIYSALALAINIFTVTNFYNPNGKFFVLN